MSICLQHEALCLSYDPFPIKCLNTLYQAFTLRAPVQRCFGGVGEDLIPEETGSSGWLKHLSEA